MRSGVGLALGMFVAAFAASAQAQSAGVPSRAFHVIHYDARIEPDIAAQTVRGSVRLDITATTGSSDKIDLDRGSLVVDAVREGRTPQTFTQIDRHLLIQLSRPLHSGGKQTLEIDYHGAPRFGLRFFPDRSQAYTVFSTSQWMVCVDAPEDRSMLRLRVILPRGLRVSASGKRIGQRTLTDGTVEHEWRTTRAVPTYTFGFAAGRFNEVFETRNGVPCAISRMDFIGRVAACFATRPGWSPSFGSRRRSVRRHRLYPGARRETIGQKGWLCDLAGVFGRTISAMRIDTLVPMNWLTSGRQYGACPGLHHFWLNEGFATFMAVPGTSGDLTQRYLQDIDAARQRYETDRDSGHDRSLVFPDWNRPTAEDRTLVYRKGAYVLHLLREELGERAFWDGIRRYTRMYFGKSVTTEDFRRTMEQSSGRDLAAFFSEWVYLTKPS